MKIALFILSFFLLISCYSYKHQFEGERTDKTKTERNETREKFTESVNDTLQGEVPLNQITAKPVEFNFGSSATRLKLNFSDGKLRYKATSKATKRTYEQINKKEEIQKDESEEIEDNTEQEWKPPWWLSGVVLFALLIVYKLFTLKFKIIRN